MERKRSSSLSGGDTPKEKAGFNELFQLIAQAPSSKDDINTGKAGVGNKWSQQMAQKALDEKEEVG